MTQNLRVLKTTFAIVLCLLLSQQLFSQAELQPWGNMAGIRVDGQLMEFESSLRVVSKDWSSIRSTAKERQRPRYTRNGNQQIVTTTIDSFNFKEVVEDSVKGTAKVSVELTSGSDSMLGGVFFTLAVPASFNAGGSVQVNNFKAIPLSSDESKLAAYLQTPARSISFLSANRQMKIVFAQPTLLTIKKPVAKPSEMVQLYVPIQTGQVHKGQTSTANFSITAAGLVDRKPITLKLNTAKAGRVFDGFGGNFRLQNARTDPQVIDYCLNNLDVRWGRAEMPWRFWQPSLDSNPIAQAKAGRLHPNVQHAMEMAQRLYKKGMPVIISAWSPPAWAVVGQLRGRPGADGVWGNPLDKAKTNEIYKSIADYMVYLKEQYGVEVSMFSFNESDLGINVRQTGEEHRDLIKGLGAYFASRGLKTKLLLGDNSDATTYTFIYPALNDPATHPYIGAISFHSWRGWENETLQKWADAATKLNLPLIVGEGSIDAQAWGYPAIFEEPTYALEEINLYTRLLAICQPAAILQWQLTADYSPMAGGGIFNDNRPLQPTRRFWNLKQLSSTPKGLQAMPLSSDATNVSVAAMGDNNKTVYAMHLVNNGATRPVSLSGLPKNVKTLQVYVTDKTRSMKEVQSVPVTNGLAKFTLDETSYTTLISK